MKRKKMIEVSLTKEEWNQIIEAIDDSICDLEGYISRHPENTKLSTKLVELVFAEGLVAAQLRTQGMEM